MTWVVDWMWQGSLLAVVAGLGLRAAGRLSAATRHHLWWVVLVAVVLLPVARAALASAGTGAGASLTLAPLPARVVLPALPSPFLLLAVALWMAVALVLIARVGREVVAVGRLRRDSTAIAPERAARFPLWSARPSGGRPVELRVSTRVAVPCALGLGPALVLLPRALVDTLEDEALDQVVMHEHAHLVRRDDWWQLAQAMVRAVGALHPAVHWICRELDFEREAACDDLVVADTGAPRRYARCLVDVAAAVCRPPAGASRLPGLVPGATRAGRALHRRVRRLVDQRHRPGARPGGVAMAAGGLAVVMGAVVLAAVEPVVVFRDIVSSLPRVAGRPPAVAAGTVALLRPATGEEMSVAAAPMRVARQTPAEARRQEPRLPSPPADVVEEAAVLRAADRPPLPARELGVGAGVSPATAHAAVTGPPPADPGPWRRMAEAGAAIGDGPKRAGQALGGFFVRSGRSVGNVFTSKPAGD